MALILQKKLVNIEKEDNNSLFDSILKKKEISFYDLKKYMIKKNYLLSESNKDLLISFFTIPPIMYITIYGFKAIMNFFTNILIELSLVFLCATTCTMFGYYLIKFLDKAEFTNKHTEQKSIKKYYKNFLKIDNTNFVNNVYNDLIHKLSCSNIETKNVFAYNSLKFQIDNVNSEFQVLKSELNINKNRDDYTNEPFEKFIKYIDSIELKIEQIKEA